MDESQFQQHMISANIPNASSGVVETAKNVANTVDMIVDIGVQKAEESGIIDKIQNKAEELGNKVKGFVKSLKFW
jgi:hypothetical protein